MTMRISARAIPLLALLALVTCGEAFQPPPSSPRCSTTGQTSFVSSKGRHADGKRQGECSQCALSLSSSTYNTRYRNTGNSSKNGNWAKLSTGLLPEAGYFKAERDEERLRIRRQREVERAIGPSSVQQSDDDHEDDHRDNNNRGRPRRSSQRQRKRGPRWPKEKNHVRHDDSIFESFRAVENVDQLNRMVDDVLGKLDNEEAIISARDVTNLVRLLGARQAYDAMLKFVRHPSTHPTVFSYTAAVASLAQSTNPKYRSLSASLLDEMDNLGIQPNTYTFTAVLLGVNGGKGAMKMMKRARQYESVDINCFLYNAAIHACSRNPGHVGASAAGAATGTAVNNDGWQTALSLFRQMKKEQIRPTEQTYASLLHACGKSGQVILPCRS